MLKIVKKIDKTINNAYGSIDIKNINDLNRPFLLGISGYDNYDKAVFGIIREGAHAARVYTTQEIAAGFKIEEMPIDFIGCRFEKDEKYEEKYQELVNEFLLPFIKMHGMNYHSILKQARKINLFTFDNGVLTYIKAEKELYQELQKNGFTEEECKTILSQISLVSLATNEDLSDLYATNIRFVDLNDKEYEDSNLSEYKMIMNQRNCPSMYVPVGSNNAIMYLFLGNGIHIAKTYLFDDCIAKTAISAMTSLFLQNSLTNQTSEKFMNISREDMIDPLYYYGANLYPTEKTICMLDQEIKYGNAPKYTSEEAILRSELDTACKCLQKAKTKIKNKEEEIENISNKMKTIVSNIRNYSSEITYYQILTASKLWYSKEDVLKEVSDKEYRNQKAEKKETEKKETKVEKEEKEEKPKTKTTKKKEPAKKTTTKKSKTTKTKKTN